MDEVIKVLMIVVVTWLVLVGPLLMVITIPVALQKRAYKDKLNPLTQSMRRPPGASLLQQIIDIDFELLTPLMCITLVAPSFISIYYIYTDWFSADYAGILKVSFVLGALLVYIYSGRKLIQMRVQLRNLRLGYECELAVAQELDQLMLHGYRVFHDIPAEGFNIDHLVVGKTGVYAIETKGRSKRDKGKSQKQQQAAVRYDGKALHFPDRVETAPIQQAMRQAKWVSHWLSGATGMPVQAQPILILPGWYINWPSSKTMVTVLPGKKLGVFFLKASHQQFTDQQVKQMAYQIDRQVKDINPGTIARVN